MKTIYKVGLLFWGLGVLGSGSVKAQTNAGQKRDIPAKNVFGRLREIVLRAQPEAKIEFREGVWRASYRSPQAKAHLVDAEGRLSKEGAEAFPADLAEFSLELSERTDSMYYRENEHEAHYQPENFGTTLIARANLRRYVPAITRVVMERYGNGDLDVPVGHWAYDAFAQLAQAGLVKEWNPQALEDQSPLLRRDFAWITVHLRNQAQQEPQKMAHSDELVAALTDLESEFAPEISDLDDKRGTLAGKPIPFKPQVRGLTQQARYRFVLMRFSYGKGLSAAFTEEIRRTIEEYGAQRLKESEAAVGPDSKIWP